MQAKSVLYAAVGAPVVAARKVGDKASAIKGKVEEQTSSYTKTAEKAIDSWAVEGEKIVHKVSEGKVVEEISSKVDLEHTKEQVGKLRDQLEDMMTTWRHSFRPEKAEEKADEKPAAKKPAAKAPAKKPAAKKPATKPAAKTSAAKTTKSSTAAKTSSAKTDEASKAKKAS